MDSLVKFKRKKLRTRKSRNELRKRLCSNSEKDFTMHFNSVCYLKDSEKCKSKSNCITTGRLTLGFVHKAIRSETITRPALSQIKKLSALTVNNILDKKNLIYNEGSSILQLSGTNIDNRENSYSTNRTSDRAKFNLLEVLNTSDKCKENFCNYRASRSDSPTEFSPPKLGTMTQITQPEEIESESPENLSLTTSSLENSESNENHWKYEDFVQNMPSYLMGNAHALVSGDIMRKTKGPLHNLYLNGCDDYEDNYFQCIQNNSEIFQTKYPQELSLMEVIKYDPMSYIRLGYTRQQAGSTTGSSLNSSLHVLDTSNASPTFIHNTPDYIYFPHKLNH